MTCNPPVKLISLLYIVSVGLFQIVTKGLDLGARSSEKVIARPLDLS